MQWKDDPKSGDNNQNRPKIQAKVAVSNAERVHAVLTAGVIVFATLVLVLFGIWLASFTGEQAVHRTFHIAPPIDFSDLEAERLVTLNDFVEPGMGELPEANQPQFQQSLVAVTDAVSSIPAARVEMLGNQEEAGKEGGKKGDENRKPGVPDNTIPDWERWKISYTAGTKDEYLKILESFGVYLGAVHKESNKIVFFTDLENDPPTKTEGLRSSPEAQVIYFRNTKSRLKKWDKSVATEGGVDEDKSIVVQFYPAEVLEKMAAAELAIITDAHKSLREVKKTNFVCRETDVGYEFYIEDIQYRPDPG